MAVSIWRTMLLRSAVALVLASFVVGVWLVWVARSWHLLLLAPVMLATVVVSARSWRPGDQPTGKGEPGG